MSLFRRGSAPHHRPDDSPDLSWMMGFVTTVGGIAAYTSKRSRAGMLAGCSLGAVFGISGALIASERPESHEIAHQMALLASVLFAGGMGYRAGANPYVGPGGSMLAALGGLSSAYHLAKWVEWRAYEASRVQQAERLLREHYQGLSRQGDKGGLGAGLAAAPVGSAAEQREAHAVLPRGMMPGPPPPAGHPGGPRMPPGGR